MNIQLMNDYGHVDDAGYFYFVRAERDDDFGFHSGISI